MIGRVFVLLAIGCMVAGGGCSEPAAPAGRASVVVKKKATDLQQALDSGDYASALQIEPRNAQALAMRREALIQQPPITNSIGMQLKLIPAGTFMMGSPDSELGLDNPELQHHVTLTKDYYLGVHEVTQEQYEKVMGKNPSEFKGAQNPVEMVSWDDAVEFCRRLSELPEERSALRFYRLPTEAEWEYACRAGTTTEYSFGDDVSMLDGYAWFGSNSGDSVLDEDLIWPFKDREIQEVYNLGLIINDLGLEEFVDSISEYAKRILDNGCQSHPVGQKRPNPWGLYDMHGNVWEWCKDWYDDYFINSVTDPVGDSSGSGRVARGGCWDLPAAYCRSAYRSKVDPSLRSRIRGFRVTFVPVAE